MPLYVVCVAPAPGNLTPERWNEMEQGMRMIEARQFMPNVWLATCVSAQQLAEIIAPFFPADGLLITHLADDRFEQNLPFTLGIAFNN